MAEHVALEADDARQLALARREGVGMVAGMGRSGALKEGASSRGWVTVQG